MSADLPPDLIAKWIAGDLGPDDQRLLSEWLSADPARAAELEELRELWRMAGEAADQDRAVRQPAEEARWAALLAAIGRAERQRPIELPFARRGSRLPTWAAAAAVLLAAGAGLWLAAQRARPDIAQAPTAMRVYATQRGQRAELRLADGTRVLLSVASRLSVPADFGNHNRTVHLEGAAYFDVVHDTLRPFAVHAGDVVAHDLGTKFSVRAYPEDRHARVVVRAGKVALRGATLTAGQAGTLDVSGRPVVQRADTAAEFAWTAGTLVLDGTPLRDAVIQLSRWFDLDFRLADNSLGGIPVAATLVSQPTDEALAFLARSLGLRAERRGRLVTLYPSEAQR